MYIRLKRFFDFIFSFSALVCLTPIIVFAFIASSIVTSSFGIFRQKRIGIYGRPFIVYKIKTMVFCPRQSKLIVPRFCRYLRASKIDELPQLLNVLMGQMSFVGPRPDLPGYADCLTGDDREILAVLPGITCLSSIVFRHEEVLLSSTDLSFNDHYLWPKKILLNLYYVNNISFMLDLFLIVATLFPFLLPLCLGLNSPQTTKEFFHLPDSF